MRLRLTPAILLLAAKPHAKQIRLTIAPKP